MKKPVTNTVRKALIVAAFPLFLVSNHVQAHNFGELLLPSYFWIENSYHLHDSYHHHRPRHVHNHHFKPTKKHRSNRHHQQIRHHDRRNHGQFHHRDDKRLIKKHSR